MRLGNNLKLDVVVILFISHRVLSLELELVDSQSLGVLQLFNLIHLLVVESDLLIDEHLHTPTGEKEKTCAHVCRFTACMLKNCERGNIKQILLCLLCVTVLHGGLGNILHAEQRVSAVWAAQHTRGKNYSQRVRRHAVVSLDFTHPARK